MYDKRFMYEPSLKMPFVVRWPGVVKSGGVQSAMAINADFAPTFMEIAGAPAPAGLHGKSLMPLLRENGPALRNAFLIEHFSESAFPRTTKLGYQALRTDAWKYIHYVDVPNADELYDLQRDPYELRNLIASPGAAGELKRLRDELARQVAAAGPRPGKR